VFMSDGRSVQIVPSKEHAEFIVVSEADSPTEAEQLANEVSDFVLHWEGMQ